MARHIDWLVSFETFLSDQKSAGKGTGLHLVLLPGRLGKADFHLEVMSASKIRESITEKRREELANYRQYLP